MFCPRDFSPCFDDLCYGGGCIEMDGASMYSRCPGCNAFISDEDMDNCVCDEQDDWTQP